MTKVEDDDTTPPPGGAHPAFKTVIFLPGATPGLAVNGVPRSEGWVGKCPAAEADDLCQRRLAIPLPDDWPALPPPTDGEPFPAFIERTVDRHASVLAIMRLGEPVGLKIPIQRMVRPGQRTVQRWELDFPQACRFEWIDNYPRETVLFYFRNYLRQRLLVELFDRLRADIWSARAPRADDVNYTPQPVRPGLFGHPDMVLHYGPRGDWFRPMQRHGWPVPAANLPSFGALTLHPQPAGQDMAWTPHSGAAAAADTIGAEKQMCSWLTKLMKAQPLNPIKKTTAHTNAVDDGLRRISVRAFARAWAGAVGESGAKAWSTGGRRKSTQ